MAVTISAQRLEERSEQLIRLYEGTVRRQQELVTMRERVLRRRSVVRADRQRLKSQQAARRLVRGDDRRAAAAILEAAARAADLSTLDVWIKYVGLGGERSFEDISGMLRGDVPIDSFSHDVLTVALNEYLMDCGSEPLLAHWDGSRRT
jgi:hypothetical protein